MHRFVTCLAAAAAICMAASNRAAAADLCTTPSDVESVNYSGGDPLQCVDTTIQFCDPTPIYPWAGPQFGVKGTFHVDTAGGEVQEGTYYYYPSINYGTFSAVTTDGPVTIITSGYVYNGDLAAWVGIFGTDPEDTGGCDIDGWHYATAEVSVDQVD